MGGLPFPDPAQFMALLLKESIRLLVLMQRLFSLLGDWFVTVGLFCLDQRTASALLSEWGVWGVVAGRQTLEYSVQGIKVTRGHSELWGGGKKKFLNHMPLK